MLLLFQFYSKVRSNTYSNGNNNNNNGFGGFSGFGGGYGEGIILNEIINIINTMKCKKSIKSIFSQLISCAPRIIFIVFIKHYVSNTGVLISTIKQLITWLITDGYKYLIYKKITYQLGSGTVGQFLLQKIKPSIDNIYGFPRYTFKQSSGELIINKMRFVNHLDLDSCFNQAMYDQSEYQESFKKKTKISKLTDDLKFVVSHPLTLFPSNNYKRLGKIVYKYIEISNRTKYYMPLGILLDGEPGLGKTKFVDYLSESGVIDHIYKCDMTMHLNKTFEDIIKMFYHDIILKGPTVFMIDEIDKYLDFIVNDL